MLRSNASLAASMHWKPESPNWKPPAAVEAEAAFLRGVRAWRAHPWRRTLPDPPAIWTEGSAQLLDYGGAGPPVLFVPSLINRWTVLDLKEGHSMLRWLAAEGVRPLLLDWGEPEPGFTLTDHIAGRLARAIGAAGEKIVLAGYCMGGTFAVAAAALRPDLVRGLALLAAPWDFHAGDIVRLHKVEAARAMLRPLLAVSPLLPVDMLQMLFALDDPTGVAEKFRRFGLLDPDGEEARLFVALEDWLNDGIPLSGTTALECLSAWYGENRPMLGTWRVAGLAIDPGSIDMPAFVAVPRRDRIVPPGSARPLGRLLPRATAIEPDAGHVGMIAGRSAPRVLWAPLRDWVRSIGSASTASRARRNRKDAVIAPNRP